MKEHAFLFVYSRGTQQLKGLITLSWSKLYKNYRGKSVRGHQGASWNTVNSTRRGCRVEKNAVQRWIWIPKYEKGTIKELAIKNKEKSLNINSVVHNKDCQAVCIFS